MRGEGERRKLTLNSQFLTEIYLLFTIHYPSFVMFRDKIIEEKEKWNLGGLDDNGCSRAS
ncbi:hypothetical protein CSQ80_01725 [Cyanobacterium aponinum IPPAS B-1201]|nr:hypothetical protein CSQ80_01725 [Cyanobacterium aponinum IPPAS B-1201]